MCIDFSNLNKACPQDPFPIPCIDQIVDSVGVLGMGVPRIACLWLAVWMGWQVYTTHLHRQGIQDPREGPSLARQTTQDLSKERPRWAGSRVAERARQGKPREVLMT